MSLNIKTETGRDVVAGNLDPSRLDELEQSISDLQGKFVTLSQAEYDALPDSKLTDDKFYFIPEE